MRQRPAALAALLSFALAPAAARDVLGQALHVSPPRLVVAQHQLANGLQVLLCEDHKVPIANLQIWYHVGSKNERPGRTGFAHLFEHLMFKGTANLAPEEFTHYIESVGGQIDATTDFDRTLYYATVPSNYLERVLWMEADRMQTLDVSEENFRSERDVVKEERRLRFDEPPFGHLFELVFEKSYTTHPYHNTPIGTMADLNAATIEDVRDFYRTYYVPNNATLVITGDFEPQEALRWVEKYFAPIPKGPRPIERRFPPEPPHTAERRELSYDDKAPLPAVVFTFHMPSEKDPDFYALEVASNILSAGESSRLYKKLVYDKQIAITAAGQTIALEDPGVFFFYAVMQAGHGAEEGEKALLEEVQRLQAEAVGEAELTKAKNQFIAGLVFERETVQAKGDAVGHAAVILGDWTWVNRQLAAYQQVTAADVQRVARQYFTPANRTTIYLLPAAMRPAAPAIKPHPAALITSPAPAPAAATKPAPASPARKSTPPQPPPPKKLRFPAFEQRTLPNGLRVVLVEEHADPAVSLRLLVPAGKLFVAAGKAGLAEATAALLTKGTQRRGAPQIAEAIDQVGGSLDSASGTDFAVASARVTSDQLDLALDLLSDVVLHPAFPSEEIERWRSQALSDLQLRRADGAYLADVVFQRAVYGGFPYGLPRLGTAESLRGLARADLVAYHQRQYVPNGSFLAVVGDIRPAEALVKVERAFGAWARGAEIALPPFSVPRQSKPRIVVIDKPDAVQTQVRVGHAGIAFADPDLVVERVYNAVLGGSSTARLFVEVREKRGLTYGAYSTFAEELLPGPFRTSTFTKTESTVEALAVTLDVIRELGTKPVPAGELEERKTTLIGSFPIEIQTPDGIAQQVVVALSHGKDRGFLETYRDRIAAVTQADVKRFAAERVHPDQAVIVLVGKAAAWAADLGKRFGPFETLPVAELDPLAPNLRRAPPATAPPHSGSAGSPPGAERSGLAGRASNRAGSGALLPVRPLRLQP
jgi:zinc protease